MRNMKSRLAVKLILENKWSQFLHTFSETIKELIDEGKIDERSERVINYSKYKYSPLADHDISLLSLDETQMDDTINNLSNFYSEEIIQYSHGDIPWRLAKTVKY